MKYEKKILLFLLALNLIRGVLYGITIPLWQAPDEHWHFEYIKLIENNIQSNNESDEQRRKELQSQINQSLVKHKFAEFRDMNPQTRPLESIAFSRDQLRQPSLYYSICACLLKIFPFNSIDAEAYGLRFLSVVLGTCVVYLGYTIAREIFAQDQFLIIGTPLFIIFLPQYTFMSSAINNDKLAEVLFSLLLVLIVMGIKYHFSPAGIIYIFMLVILGLLTKRTFWVAIPVCYLFFLIYFENAVYKLMSHILVLSMAGLVIFTLVRDPYFIDTLERYIEVSSSQIASKGIQFVVTFSTRIWEFSHYMKLMLSNFWVSFGWVDIFLSDLWYNILLLVDAVAIIGISVFTINILKKKIVLEAWQKKNLLILAVSIVFVFLQLFIRDNLLFSAFPHSRLLFVAIIPISVFFMIGLREWLKSMGYQKALLLVTVLLAGFDAMCFFFYILPYYYGVFG